MLQVLKKEENSFFIKKDNGDITLIPKVEDHFVYVAEGEFYMQEENVGYAPGEGELDE